MSMKPEAGAGRILAVVAAGGFLALAGVRSVHGQGMPPALRENIHLLFDRHDAVKRVVTPTDDGYVSVTESEDPKVAAALRGHVAQMEERLKEGFGVRRWDPAFPEYAGMYRDMDVRVEPLDRGVRVTVKGRTPDAVKVARNHAKVIDDFVAHGWEAHDRSHPAVLGASDDRRPGRGPGGGGHGGHGGPGKAGKAGKEEGAGHGGHGDGKAAEGLPAKPGAGGSEARECCLGGDGARCRDHRAEKSGK